MNETYRPSSLLPLTLLLLYLPSSFNVATPASILHSFNTSAPRASTPSIHRCLLLLVPLHSIPSTEVAAASAMLPLLLPFQIQVQASCPCPCHGAITSAMSLHVLPVQLEMVHGSVFPHGRWQDFEVPISNTTVPASVIFC